MHGIWLLVIAPCCAVAEEAVGPKSNHKAGAGKSSRKILITAGEGQTGRLVIDLLATNEEYTHKYQELTALVFSEAAKSVLDEYESVKVAVFDPSDEEALVRCMEAVDTCLLIPPARKVR